MKYECHFLISIKTALFFRFETSLFWLNSHVLVATDTIYCFFFWCAFVILPSAITVMDKDIDKWPLSNFVIPTLSSTDSIRSEIWSIRTSLILTYWPVSVLFIACGYGALYIWDGAGWFAEGEAEAANLWWDQSTARETGLWGSTNGKGQLGLVCHVFYWNCCELLR